MDREEEGQGAVRVAFRQCASRGGPLPKTEQSREIDIRVNVWGRHGVSEEYAKSGLKHV